MKGTKGDRGKFICEYWFDIELTFFLGLDGVCGARDGLKGSKGEPGYPGEAGKRKVPVDQAHLILMTILRYTGSTW